ncbi:MAG: hypothetical protein AABZ31_10080 [Bdellovibrionota bacterium]
MKKQTLKIMMIGLIALASLVGAGCSKSKSGNGNYNGYGYGYGGYGYGTNGGFRALGNEPSGYVQLGLELGYVGAGQVQGGGEMTVVQGFQCPYPQAGLTTGAWSVRTVQPGVVDGSGAIRQLRLEAQGPNGRAILTIDNATVFSLNPKTFSCSGMQGFDELAALVKVESVNGYPCGATFSVYLLNSSRICGGY